MDSRDFLGRGVKFPLQVDPRTGKFSMVSHEEDIREAIEIILRTMQGDINNHSARLARVEAIVENNTHRLEMLEKQ